MTRKQPATYRRVNGLGRGLGVLEALNACPGGSASAIQLSAAAGLHRTTTKRLLETLRAAGYVRFCAEGNAYCLTVRVRQLSEGFRDEAWIAQVATPLLHGLTRRIVWPSNLATLAGDEMIIRESTHASSPLSFHSSMVGRRLPLLATSLGRAYAAFCPREELELLLELLRARSDAQGALARDAGQVSRILDSARTRGYAVYEGEWMSAGRFGALAVPIRARERVAASLNVLFSKKALSTAEAARRYAGELRGTAEAIERELLSSRRTRSEGRGAGLREPSAYPGTPEMSGQSIG